MIHRDGVGQVAEEFGEVLVDGTTGAVYEGDALHTPDEGDVDEYLTELLGYLPDTVPVDHPLAQLRSAHLERA